MSYRKEIYKEGMDAQAQEDVRQEIHNRNRTLNRRGRGG